MCIPRVSPKCGSETLHLAARAFHLTTVAFRLAAVAVKNEVLLLPAAVQPLFYVDGIVSQHESLKQYKMGAERLLNVFP